MKSTLVSQSLFFAWFISSAIAAEPKRENYIRDAFAFLCREHDRGQQDLVILDDRDSGNEHFFPSGWMGDMERVGDQKDQVLQTNWTSDIHDGLTSVRWSMPADFGVEGWGGVFWEFPEGKEMGPGHDLSRYISMEEPGELRFWAKQLEGKGEVTVSFRWVNLHGLQVAKYYFRFTDAWKEYSLRLPTKAPLSNVTGAFGVSAASRHQAIELLLDNARICFGPKGRERRLNQPRFVRSYVPENAGAPDRHFRNASYVYDNAIIVLAFCARGEPDDLRRARLICDAFGIVQDHDPAHDGRLRSAYMCGELLDRSRQNAPRMPGYWDDQANAWVEDQYALSSDCGNMAWAAIALLECWKHSGGQSARSNHLRSAQKLCEWIHDHSFSTEGLSGYTGGIDTQSPTHGASPPGERRIPWKSCEHNIDIYVAFARLALATGDQVWQERALHAKDFVIKLLALQKAKGNPNLPTGTLPDGTSLNTSVQPLDVNPWALLAFRDAETFTESVREAARLCAVNHKNEDSTVLRGFDFNEDLDGVWWEGTGQMALAYRFLGEQERADEILLSIRRNGASNRIPGAIMTATRDGLTTGFNRESGEPWLYWRRAQTGGATCWYLFAELGWNPYWGESLP